MIVMGVEGEGAYEAFDLAELIGRYAGIQGQLEAMGATGLVKEAESIKEAIKSRMLRERVESITDEVSLWGADLSVRTKDVWDIEALREAYPQARMATYLDTVVNTQAIKDAIKRGVMSRAKLEEAGAVKKDLLSIALKLGKRKEEENDVRQD